MLGLLLTGYVAWSLRRVKNTYIFRLRAPQLVKDLTEGGSMLINYANDFANAQQEIGDEIARLDVKLKVIQGRMRGRSQGAVRDLRARIRDWEREPYNEAKFRLVYRGIQRVIEEVKEYQEDLDLE